MKCPFCGSSETQVIDSRVSDAGDSIRRRRRCQQCQKRFTTYERIEEQVRLTVVKKDGSRVPWDRGKILTGLERACYKRPVQAGPYEAIYGPAHQRPIYSQWH